MLYISSLHAFWEHPSVSPILLFSFFAFLQNATGMCSFYVNVSTLIESMDIDISFVIVSVVYLVFFHEMLATSTVSYAPNFDEVEGAYWFGPVRLSVRPLGLLLSPRTTKLWRGYRVCPVRMYVSTYVRMYVRTFVRMFTRSSDLIYYPISI